MGKGKGKGKGKAIGAELLAVGTCCRMCRLIVSCLIKVTGRITSVY